MAKTKTRRVSGHASSAAPSRAAKPLKQSNNKVTPKASRKSNQKMNGSLLEDYFVDALKDMYWAEKALTKALPRMAKSATSQELKKTFQEHLEVTKKQISRLEDVFEQLGKKAQGKKCEAMQGLVEESETIISETKDDTFTRDAALIIAAQKVEHYEIASYGGLVQLAKTMNKNNIAKTLEATLNEEKKADALLTQVAEKSINAEAAGEPGEGSEGNKSLKETVMSLFS